MFIFQSILYGIFASDMMRGINDEFVFFYDPMDVGYGNYDSYYLFHVTNFRLLRLRQLLTPSFMDGWKDISIINRENEPQVFYEVDVES